MEELWARDSGCLLKVAAFIVSRRNDPLSFLHLRLAQLCGVERSGIAAGFLSFLSKKKEENKKPQRETLTSFLAQNAQSANDIVRFAQLSAQQNQLKARGQNWSRLELGRCGCWLRNFSSGVSVTAKLRTIDVCVRLRGQVSDPAAVC